MSRTIALIPARTGSKGIPGKNFMPLAGKSPIQRALDVAVAASVVPAIISTDMDLRDLPVGLRAAHRLQRPHELAQDDTPMIAVVRHALAQIPGEPDDIILLVQPTQPLRKPEHLTAAITLLQESGADSVVSVVELPLTYSPELHVTIRGGRLEPYVKVTGPEGWWSRVYMRQHCDQTYLRDGTVYAFWRRTVETHGCIYGERVRPLIIPASETCPLDTPEDWPEAERRLRATT